MGKSSGKGKNRFDEIGSIDILDTVIVEALLQEERVVLPELGYLELKSIAGRRTVLFKALKPADPVLQVFSDPEEKKASVLYKHISVPLLEGKVVLLPALGIFHPLKKEDGSLRVSFTPAASLRKQLNGEEETAMLPAVIAKPAETKKPENAVESGTGKQEQAATAEPKEAEQKIEVVVAPVEKITLPKEPAEMQKAAVKKPAVNSNIAPIHTISPSAEAPSKQTEGKNKNSLTGIIIAILLIVIAVTGIFLFSTKEEEQPVADDPAVTSTNLPDLAYRSYGNAIFWVYIYEANRTKLTSPVNIPEGIELIVPDLSQFHIDVTDSMEIRKARTLSDMILRQKE
jgi:hypothetical protein